MAHRREAPGSARCCLYSPSGAQGAHRCEGARSPRLLLALGMEHPGVTFPSTHSGDNRLAPPDIDGIDIIDPTLRKDYSFSRHVGPAASLQKPISDSTAKLHLMADYIAERHRKRNKDVNPTRWGSHQCENQLLFKCITQLPNEDVTGRICEVTKWPGASGLKPSNRCARGRLLSPFVTIPQRDLQETFP